MIRNALIAMFACFVVTFLLAALLQEAVIFVFVFLPVGVCVACTTLVMQEIDVLRREIRGEKPPEYVPLSEQIERGAQAAAPSTDESEK